ncbi:glycosyltransferase [Planctomycetota bacterium]
MFPSRQLPRHGIFLQRQIRALERLGIRCTFLVPRPWAPWPLTHMPRWRGYGSHNPLLSTEEDSLETVRYVRPPGQWFRRYEARAMARSLVPAAQGLHEQRRFDAIWACPLFPDAVAAVAVKQQLSLPLVSLSIGSDVLVYPRQQPALDRQLRQTLTHVDLPMGVSQAICRRLDVLGAHDPMCVYLGRDQKQFAPVGNRPALRQQLGWSKDVVVGVYVGLLAPSKGMTELSMAATAALAHHPQFHLVCVGSGPSQQQLAAHNHPRIHLPGELAPEQIPRYLQAADFFVFPSHSEGMPQAVLEAMQCGLPIVATDVGGIPEAVSQNDNGLLIPAQRADLLQGAMERMITDPTFREHAGQRSQAIAAERFDSEVNTKRLADAIKYVVHAMES